MDYIFWHPLLLSNLDSFKELTHHTGVRLNSTNWPYKSDKEGTGCLINIIKPVRWGLVLLSKYQMRSCKVKSGFLNFTVKANYRTKILLLPACCRMGLNYYCRDTEIFTNHTPTCLVFLPCCIVPITYRVTRQTIVSFAGIGHQSAQSPVLYLKLGSFSWNCSRMKMP